MARTTKQSEQTQPENDDVPSTAVTAYKGPQLPALVDNQIVDMLNTLIDGGMDKRSWPRVRNPSGKSGFFGLPVIDYETALETIEPVKEITGFVTALRGPMRAFWPEKSSKPTAPACSSEDGLIGMGRNSFDPRAPSGTANECAVCPMAQFGSARSDEEGKERRGQACKQFTLMLLHPTSPALGKSHVMPFVVSVPPTSIKPMREFSLRLAQIGVPLKDAVITIGLTQHADGYFVFSPRKVADIPEEFKAQREKLSEFGTALLYGIRAASVDSDVVNGLRDEAQGQRESV